MARPRKTGLDYFPMDTLPNEKLELLQAECGLPGFAIYIKLLQRIYRKGFYLEWNDKERLIFTSKNQVKTTTVDAVIETCIKWDLFHQGLYESHRILTSEGVQKRYFEITKRRKNDAVFEEFILINAEETELIDALSMVSAAKTPVYTEKSTQRKEKKIKRKNIKKEKVDAEHLECFENLLWKSYPRKDGKLKAKKAFLKKIVPKLNNIPDLIEKILKNIERRQQSPEWKKENGAYIPHLATFLNQERWTDEGVLKPDWRNT